MIGTRRKIWNLMIDAPFKGYLKNASGYPLTLSGCMPEYPVSLSVSGNTVQDGTPAPDNPVEIQGCGDRTANLLNPDIIEVGRIDTTTGANSGGSSICRTAYIPMEYSEYTFNLCSTDYGTVTFFAYDSDYNFMGRSYSSAANAFYNINRTSLLRGSLTDYADNDITYFRIAIGLNNHTVDDVKGDVMLVEGSYTAETMPDYELYGYKVPLLMSGKNLLPDNHTAVYKRVDTTKLAIDGNSIRIEKNDAFLQERITIVIPTPKSNTYVTLSAVTENVVYYGMACTNTMPTSTYASNPSAKTVNTGDYAYIVIVVTLSSAFTGTAVISNIMLNEGTDAAGYEPYHEPLVFTIYSPVQITADDAITIDMVNRTALLTQSETVTDISGMQDLDCIPKFWRGTVVLSADTTLSPSSIESTYYADKLKEEN